MPHIPKKNSPKPWITPRKPFEGRVQSKFYGLAIWSRTRQAFIMKHPLCLHCWQQGKSTPSTDVDHIIPINPVNAFDFDGIKYGHPLDSSNLQPLCIWCHAKKTGGTKGVEYR
jgi:5-methylcytosine-specific restriction enzyme A